MALRSRVLVTCQLIVIIITLITLSMSSFFAMQFGGDVTHEAAVIFTLASLLLIFLFVSPRWNSMLAEVCRTSFFLESSVCCIIFASTFMIALLVKYPKLDFHPKYIGPCKNELGTRNSVESQYSLFSVACFVVVALVVSWQRKQKMDLGFFNILLQLAMDISMEIPGTNRPNLRFPLFSALFCVVLIFLRRCNVEIGNGHIWKSLKLIATTIGVILLYLCSFANEQFEKTPKDAKGVFFIVLGNFLVLIVPEKALKWIDGLVKASWNYFLVKVLVGSLMLLFVSGLMFLNKYPGFRTHQQQRPSCFSTTSTRNIYDLLSAGSLSIYVLIVSSEKRQPMQLGVFSFLLELTMYLGIEISQDNPGAWFLGVFGFCVVLILVRSRVGNADNAEGVNNQETELTGVQVVPNGTESAEMNNSGMAATGDDDDPAARSVESRPSAATAELRLL